MFVGMCLGEARGWSTGGELNHVTESFNIKYIIKVKRLYYLYSSVTEMF